MSSTERRCETVTDTTVKRVGYDVSDSLDGRQGVVRMSFNPGKTIPVKDGQLVLTPPQSTPKPASPS